MKPVYISATLQDSGKTSFMCGLMQILREERGLDVGYFKPVGQRYIRYQGENIDEDAVLVREAFGLEDPPPVMSPIAIERGFTERYIFDRDPKPLEAEILRCAKTLKESHQCLLVEGTGHAGVGSCFDLSNARVAQLLDASVIIITTGGIGRPIDEIALSLSLFRQSGVDVLGVVLNKVLEDKYDKIKKVVAKGLEHLGTRLLGTIPNVPALGFPTMKQIAEELGCRILCGQQALDNRIRHTVVAAMQPHHVIPYILDDTLVVTPGDRIDNILISLVSHLPVDEEGEKISPRVNGLLLTGRFVPPPGILLLLRNSGIPVLACEYDTFTVTKQIGRLAFKILPQDHDKIQATRDLVDNYVDVDTIVATLTR